MKNKTLKQKVYELFYYCKAEPLRWAVVVLSSSQSRGGTPWQMGKCMWWVSTYEKRASSAKLVQNYVRSLLFLFILFVFKPDLSWPN